MEQASKIVFVVTLLLSVSVGNPGFDIPGFGSNWPGNGIGGGYGSGYGGPKGGHSKSGVVRPSVVCKEKGPCYKKKLTCPAKCFTAYSGSGKGLARES
ncbi:glycine-rich protein [Artemisia annua]|uniref:Glycine-rich protein n=1 Tax=Artemisia annua TaxID=35608 RepID=A0A2U1MZN8_ARTAN|nr:glycine-rich protein [Artemisia annua]